MTRVETCDAQTALSYIARWKPAGEYQTNRGVKNAIARAFAAGLAVRVREEFHNTTAPLASKSHKVTIVLPDGAARVTTDHPTGSRWHFGHVAFGLFTDQTRS